jgi:hypothetical protein
LMRKGVTALQNLRLLKWCAEIGITPSWNLLYGFPGEPPQEYTRMSALIPSLVHLDPPSFTPIEVERFSPYYNQPGEFGLEIVGPQPQYKFLYAVAPEALSNIAYVFEHRYSDGRDPQTYTKDLGEAVARWRELSQRAKGTLIYRRGPGFLLVQDRRPGLESADYRFDGVEAKIYLACDAGITAAEIHRQLVAEGENQIDTTEIESYLQELVEAKLIYREGKNFLALAIAIGGVEVPRPIDPWEAQNADNPTRPVLISGS